MILSAALQPFLLKPIHITSDILIDRPDTFQHYFTEHIFTDIVSGASATVALAGACIVVLLTVKAPAGDEMQLVPAIGTEQQA